MMGLNLHKIINTNLNAIQPLIDATLYVFVGQTKDNDMNFIVQYDELPIKLRMQHENKQDLKHVDTVNVTKIKKKFYIEINQLTGLNRNIGSGGDKIQVGNLYYKIVEVQYNFQTGWVKVIGTESASLS